MFQFVGLVINFIGDVNLQPRGNCLINYEQILPQAQRYPSVHTEEARQTGSKFFQQNKIRSCSFVKETSDGFKAVPFY